MTRVNSLARRLVGSAVVWSWAFNFVRLGASLLLLPLLLRFLSNEDFGMHYVFVALVAFVPMADFGLMVSIERAAGYAMGGARDLLPHGVQSGSHAETGPNYELLWRLLHTTQILYRLLALVLLLGLGAAGFCVVGLRVQETTSPAVTWTAWGITLISATLELYSGWWSAFLRALNQTVSSARILFFAYLIKFLVSAGLLIAGAGLLSLPVAGFVSSFLMRYLARRECLAFLPATKSSPPSRTELMATLRVLWPNTWRLGVHFFSTFVNSYAGAFIATTLFPLAANAQYGLSMQVMAIIATMSAVWVSVKWPLINQCQARRDMAGLRRILRPRLQLQMATYVIGASLAIPLLPWLLELVDTTKTVLPPLGLSLVALLFLFEMHLNTWFTLISTGNQMPMLRSVVTTHLVGVGLAVILVTTTSWGLSALVAGPLIAGSLFNYWSWPAFGARGIGSTWRKVMFARS